MPHLTAAISLKGLFDSELSLELFDNNSQEIPDKNNSYFVNSFIAMKNQKGAIKNTNNFLIALTGKPNLKDMLTSAEDVCNKIREDLENKGIENFNEMLSQIYGEFVIAIIDLNNKQCHLASDRPGIQRLYWHINKDGVFAFSTSLKELSKLCNKQRNISHQALYSYIYFHMIPTPLSIYEGISKLQPGHVLTYVNNKINSEPYWLPKFDESSNVDIDNLSADLHEKLNKSVQRCINGETNYATFLSGGLDSSTITGVASRINKQITHSYSIGFNAKEYDETPFAKITSQHFATKHHSYFVTPEDVAKIVPKIAATYDEPFGNSSAVPTYYCAKVAADNGVKLMLAGDGGDEIFAGNTRYASQRHYRHYQALPKTLRKGLFDHFINTLPSGFPLATKAQNYIKQAKIPLPDRLQIYNFLHRHDPYEIFNKDYLAKIDTEMPLQLQRKQYARPKNASELNRMLYLDWQFTLADNDLRKVSTMCDLAGVKVAYPLLNNDLINFSCRIPSNLKLKKGQLRYFFKYAMKEFLPKETLSKSKHGFGLPFGIWLNSYKPLRELAHDSLNNLKKRHYFNSAFIDKALKMHECGHASYYGELIWILMMLELWLQANTDSEVC